MAKYKRPDPKKVSRYDKPGKGVSKEEAKKRGILHMFKVFFRNIRKMVIINVIYFAVLFPIACAITILFLSNNQEFKDLVSEANVVSTQSEEDEQTGADSPETTAAETESSDGVENTTDERNWLQKLIDSFPLFSLILLATIGVVSINPYLSWVLLLFLLASIVFYGPITAGITFCMRNFSREEHAWVSDVWTRAKRNWKQATIFGLIDLIILFGVAIYHFTPAEQFLGFSENSIPILKYLSTAVGVLYYIMRGYIYLMIVTFNLKFTAVFKNAFSFAVLGIKQNVIMLLLSIAVIFVTILSGYLSAFLIPLVSLSLLQFLCIYLSYISVDYYMVQPALAEKAVRDGETGPDPIFRDTIPDIKKK